MIQLILYDQFNIQYLHDTCEEFLFLYNDQSAKSPYGKLEFHRLSKKLEYECSKEFISQLQKLGKAAKRISCKNYEDGLLQYCVAHNISHVCIMTPSEAYIHRLFLKIQDNLKQHHIQIEFTTNTQFLISHEEFRKQFPKPPVMEIFYRRMRKKYNILMDDDKPLGGKWNFDKENRSFDKTYKHSNTDDLDYPTSRKQALELLDIFVSQKIHRFGELEDAMYTQDHYVYHSLLSSSINFGLLTPREVISAVQHTQTSIHNKEGFIRQILGWREYMYHWFHYYKETIYSSNALHHELKLPSWFWRPEHSPLQIHCVNHVLQTVKKTGYSHHITRLMIIGNFTLLMGYHPQDVNKRFREMYVDAFEWVVTPNVLGMSQFADGGNLATKPYISSANYINTMSDYCSSCYYDPKIKTGERACPFNYLYRNFVDKHKDLFQRQPYIVSNLGKIDIEEMRRQAREFISQVTNDITA